jgi:hypothetical protein
MRPIDRHATAAQAAEVSSHNACTVSGVSRLETRGLEANVTAQFTPVRRIERSQLRAYRDGYAAFFPERAMDAGAAKRGQPLQRFASHGSCSCILSSKT